MAYRQYKCLESHYTGTRFYKQDLVYLFTSDPGSRFELAVNDPRNAAGIDRDGTWYPGPINFDDFRFPLFSAKLGALSKPDFDYTDIGLLFPQNDAAEKAYAAQITYHRMQHGPDVIWHPHIHYYQDEATIPVWKYQFRITSAGGTVGAFSDVQTSVGTQEFTYSSGKIHQIMEFPPIRAYDYGFTGTASMVDLILWRDDNVVTGDVTAKEFDFHVPFDAPLGSGQDYLK